MEKNNKKATPEPEHKDAKPADAKVVSAEENVTLPKKEFEAILAKCLERDGFEDKYIRTHAEFENARRRLEKDKVEFLKYANEAIVVDFLPILDTLEISEKHVKEAKDFKAVQEGVDMIHGQIQRFMKDIGVERIKVMGERFDPHMHEAVEVEESGDKEDGTIVSELKAGYRFNSKLLRPAMVKIIKRIEGKK